MRTDADLIKTFAKRVEKASGGSFGQYNDAFAKWSKGRLPEWLMAVFATHVPKTEVWAGAGVLFAEHGMIKWNNDFPSALSSSLLIIGSAPNGDHITLDLSDGAVGYIDHEPDWVANPRNFFIKVSPSLGTFINDINDGSKVVPEDYWAARANEA